VAPISAERILVAFEAAGLHSTRPRRLIARHLAEIAATGGDFATDDLWRQLQRVAPPIGRATVFRAVEALVGLGLLDRVAFADGTHRYRICGARHHHHLTCTQCRQIIEIPVCLPTDQFSAIARQTGFDIEGHALELFGICPSCREAAPPLSAPVTLQG
jgi:Fe2+ or Zn2+ uptake regulation protein